MMSQKHVMIHHGLKKFLPEVWLLPQIWNKECWASSVPFSELLRFRQVERNPLLGLKINFINQTVEF